VARPQDESGRLSDLARHVVLPSGSPRRAGRRCAISAASSVTSSTSGRTGSAGRAGQAVGRHLRGDGRRGRAEHPAAGREDVPGEPHHLRAVRAVPRPEGAVDGAPQPDDRRTRSGRCRGSPAARRCFPHLAHNGIRTANGEQEIRFRNGSVIMFGAREQGFGRGFDEVDVEVFDEAQILTEKALEDMVAATNQARHPHGALLFYMGTPPRPVDPGEAFTLKRTKALSGKSDDMLYVEMAADPDADPTTASSGRRPTRRSRSGRRWSRCCGCGRTCPRTRRGSVRPSASGTPSRATASSRPRRGRRGASGVDRGRPVRARRRVRPGPAYASVSLAGQRLDDDWHFELEDDQTHPRRRRRLAGAAHRGADRREPAGARGDGGRRRADRALLEKRPDGRWFFKGTKVRGQPIKVAELGDACSLVLNGIVTGWLHHIGQPQFTAAALAPGSGRWATPASGCGPASCRPPTSPPSRQPRWRWPARSAPR
jgi:hypothetical protein